MGLGKFFHNATRAVSHAVHGVTHAVTHPADLAKEAVHTVGHAASGMSNSIKTAIAKVEKIPVLGPVLGTTTPLHYVNFLNNVARGERIDKAAMRGLKDQINSYREEAPYAASVIAFVPGIGPGVGAAINAGVALSEGKRWNEIAIAAAKGAIPGGAIAQAAFSAAVTAAQGKPIDQIAISALPVSDQVKQAISTGLTITKDIAAGKRVDKTLLSKVDDAIKIAGPELGKALQVGQAIGFAKKLQDEVAQQIATPQALDALDKLGAVYAKVKPVIAAGQKIVNAPEFQRGYNIAQGLMHGKKVTETMLDATRNALPPEGKKGFDMATAYHIGQHEVGKRPARLHRVRLQKAPGGMHRIGTAKPGKPTEAQSFSYYATHGLVGASSGQKTGIVKELAAAPDTRKGAVDAIKTVAAWRAAPPEEEGWWSRVKKWLFG